MLLLFYQIDSVSQKITTFDKPIILRDSSITQSISSEDKIASINFKKLNNDSLVYVENNKIDSNRIIKKHFRFGYAHNKSIDVLKTGSWDTLANSDRICRIQIFCPGAFSINFVFDDFYLPESTSLYFYNHNKSIIFGGFSQLNNQKSNHFSTVPIPGDNLIIEYYEANTSNSDSTKLIISSIIHGFRNVTGLDDDKIKKSNLDKTLNDNNIPWCSKGANCSEGNEWCNEKHSVAGMYYYEFKWSATLLNSYNGFFILTTNVLDGILDENDLDGILDNSEKAALSDFVFQFDDFRLFCDHTSNLYYPNGMYSYNGATFKSGWNVTDFLLIEPNNSFSKDDHRFFAGWSYTNPSSEPAPKVTCFHFPEGASMQISYDNNYASTDSWGGGNAVYWKMRAEQDVCYFGSGSSGAPFFDENHKIIGQLRGHLPASYCNRTYQWGGKFSESWIGGGTDETQLKHWLAPNSTGNISIDGYAYPQEVYGIQHDATYSSSGQECEGMIFYDDVTYSYYLKSEYFNIGELSVGSARYNRNIYLNPVPSCGFYGTQQNQISYVTTPFIVEPPASDPDFPETVNLISTDKITIKPCTKILHGTNVYFSARIGCADTNQITDSYHETQYNPDCCDNSLPKIGIREPGFINQGIKQNESKLIGNKPNPFNETTEIQYFIDRKGFVQITVFDLYGRVVGVPVKNESHESGFGKATFDSHDLPSGVYFYNLQTKDFSATKQMLIMK